MHKGIESSHDNTLKNNIVQLFLNHPNNIFNTLKGFHLKFSFFNDVAIKRVITISYLLCDSARDISTPRIFIGVNFSFYINLNIDEIMFK